MRKNARFVLHYLNSFLNIAPKPLVSQQTLLDKNVFEFYHGPTEKKRFELCMSRTIIRSK